MENTRLGLKKSAHAGYENTEQYPTTAILGNN